MRGISKCLNAEVQQIIKENKESGQEPVLGETVGRPAKTFDRKEAEAIREAHACYRLGARMLEPIKLLLGEKLKDLPKGV